MEQDSGWRYQIILHDDDPENLWLGLHEVLYDESGRLTNHTANAWFESDASKGREGLVAILEKALRDIKDSSVLVESELETQYAQDRLGRKSPDSNLD